MEYRLEVMCNTGVKKHQGGKKGEKSISSLGGFAASHKGVEEEEEEEEEVFLFFSFLRLTNNISSKRFSPA